MTFSLDLLAKGTACIERESLSVLVLSVIYCRRSKYISLSIIKAIFAFFKRSLCRKSIELLLLLSSFEAAL